MSVIKGIFKYLFILIGIIFAVGVIMVGVMYFFPSVNLFGYHFYKGVPYTINISAYGEDNQNSGDHIIRVNEDIAKNFDVLILKTKDFNINVATYKTLTTEAPLFQYKFNAGMKGFKLLSDPIPSVEIKTYSDKQEKVLSFEIKEPKGIFIRNNTNLFLEFPEDSSVFSKLKIENNLGNITFGNNDKNNYFFNINNVDVKSGNGNIILRKINILSNLNIEKHFGDFIVNSNISSNITTNCDDGRYYFQNILAPNDGREYNNITIANKNGSVNFENIDGNVGIKMNLGLFKSSKIDGQLSVLNHPITKNNSCDIEIEKVTKQILINNNSGKIDIGETSTISDNSDSSKLDVTSNSSDIKIKNCFSKNIKINSGKGNIILGNCLGSMDIKTTYGFVQVDYMKQNANFTGVESSIIQNAVSKLTDKIINIETGFNKKGDGAMIINNISSCAQLISNGSGNIKASFINIINNNTITSNLGACEITVPNQQHLLKWSANRNADIAVFTVVTNELNSNSYNVNESIKLDEGWLKIFNASSSEKNKLEVISQNSQVKIVEAFRL